MTHAAGIQLFERLADGGNPIGGRVTLALLDVGSMQHGGIPLHAQRRGVLLDVEGHRGIPLDRPMVEDVLEV